MTQPTFRRERRAGSVADGLTRWQAVPLAVGSVAGSGILFLPSAVYAEAGGNSLLVWVVSVVICVPMLLMFQDMVRTNPRAGGLAAFIEHGLGRTLAHCVPIMFLSLVVIGLPAGAVVAGRYLARATGLSSVTVLGATGVLVVAWLTVLSGTRTSRRVQGTVTWALIGTGIVLVATATGSAQRGPGAIMVLDGSALGMILPTVVLAFWAFAGFENLTFLAAEFRDPRRDFLPVSVIALTGYGVLTVVLTVAVAVRVPHSEVDPGVGLLQLTNGLHPAWLPVALVTGVAVAAMTLNAVSWIWGVSRLVTDAAASGVLPRCLADRAQGSSRALLLLAGLLAAALAGLLLRPDLIVDAVAAASGIFILMYLACIVSYLKVGGLTVRSGLNAALIPVMVVALVQSGWRSAYGLGVLVFALTIQSLRARHRIVPAPGGLSASQATCADQPCPRHGRETTT